MRSRKVLSVYLCCALALPALAEAPPELAPLDLPAPPPERSPRWLHKGRQGTLIVKSATKGATVQIDGLEVGTVPVKPLSLKAGKHEVKVLKPGYREMLMRVAITAGKKTWVVLDLKAVRGVLQVGAEVPGAHLFVDGKDRGAAPLTLEVAPGERHLRLQAGGSAPVEKTLTVVAGKEYLLFGAGQPPPELALPSLPPLPDTGALAEKPSPGAPMVAAPPPAAAETPALPALPPIPSVPSAPSATASKKATEDGPPPALAASTSRRGVPSAALEAPAQGVKDSRPLTSRWYFWGGAVAVAAVVAAGVVYALPAKYVEKRDPSSACGGPCGIVINNPR